MKLYYRTLGEGTPLVILHGLLGTSDNWMTLGNVFAKYYQVVLVDLRNHGRSPHSEIWDYASMADDISNLSDQLNLKKINLIGHSLGGKVAMTLAERRPSLINKLVIADIAPKQYPVRHQDIINGLLSLNLKNLKSRKEADAQLSKYVKEIGVRMFLLKNLDKGENGEFTWKMNLSVINDQLENVGSATIPNNKITIPTLFVRGANSDHVTDEDIMEIRKYYTKSTVESIGNAGHWIHAEQPDAFSKTVLNFLID